MIAPNVVWVGIEPSQLCRNKDDVLATFQRAMHDGVSGDGEIVAAAEDRLVIDPRLQPPMEAYPELHHVFVLDDERIVEMRDYPNRASALEAAGLA